MTAVAVLFGLLLLVLCAIGPWLLDAKLLTGVGETMREHAP